MKVLFLTNIPSPYRVEFFNELGKKCDLTVLFEKSSSSERNGNWDGYRFENFRGIIMKGISTSVDTAFCPSVITYIKKEQYDRIILTNFNSLTTILSIIWLKSHKKEYFLEADGGFAKSGRGIKEKIKKELLSGANGYFSSSRETDCYFITYGASQNKMIRYPFTSVREQYLMENLLSYQQKKKLKKKLGMEEEKVIIAVGQFIHRKGFDILLNAAKAFPEVGIYIVGGEAIEEYIQIKEKNNLQHTHFCGYKDQDTLKQYYMAADLFCLPTREDIWGLVVNEAIACGLPVVTTNRCGAGLAMVKNGENGYIVPTDDVDALAAACTNVLSDSEKGTQMAKKSLEIAGEYTIENMAKRHLEVLSK